jgi:HEAT repeat protein
MKKQTANTTEQKDQQRPRLTPKEFVRLVATSRLPLKGVGGAIQQEIFLRKKFFSLDEASRFEVANLLSKEHSEIASLLLTNVLRRDPSPLVRHEAAFALGTAGKSDSVRVLKTVLAGDKSALVRHEAAMALSEIGQIEDLPALEVGLKDRSREVAISCRVAISRITQRAVLP